MSNVTDAERDAFFKEVDEACKKAIWCAVATISGDELSHLLSNRPCEATLLMPEELRLDQLVRNRRTVHRHPHPRVKILVALNQRQHAPADLGKLL